MYDDLQPRAAQHRFGGRTVGNPPVRLILRVATFHEVHCGIVRIEEDLGVPEVIVFLPLLHVRRAPQHGLKHQAALAVHFLDYFVEGEEGISQVVKQAHEKHIIKLSRDALNVVHGALLELDIQLERLRRKACLVQVTLAYVNTKHAISAPAFRLDRIEAAVAANIQNRSSPQVLRQRMRDVSPLDVWKVAQEMVRSGPDTVEIEVVKPVAQLPDLLLQ